MSPYTIVLRKFTHVLVKKELGRRQRQLGKRAVIKVGNYMVSMDRKTTVYGLEAGKIAFIEYKLSIATRSRISLACL